MFYTYVAYGFVEPALDMAPALFERIAREAGVSIDMATYAREAIDHPEGEDVVFATESWASFLEKPQAIDFRFSDSAKDPKVFGGINSGSAGGFPVVDISLQEANVDQKIHDAVFMEISNALKPSYGFMYNTSRASDAISYALLNGAAIYKGLENPFLFSSDLSSRGGPDTYKRNHLRMVYEINLINSGHLETAIDGITFRDWIERGNNGYLRPLASSLFIWTVPKKKLERINNELGHAGFLISWKAKKKLSSRLP